MKTMILIETEAERAIVEKVWKRLQDTIATDKDAKEKNYVFAAVDYFLDEECDLLYDTTNTHIGAIVYVREGEGDDMRWHIYNFNTLKDETVEGDLAGLANAKDGNFPLF